MGVSDDGQVSRPRDPGTVAPFALLAVSLAGAFVLVTVAPHLSSRAPVPWFVGLTAVAAGLQFWGQRAPERSPQARAAFWASLAVTGVLVLLNPAFGLYVFIAYPASTRQLRGRERTLALVAVAAVAAVAQAGGLGSPILTPPVWLLFVLVNLVVAGSMHAFDRQRQRQSEALEAANTQLRIAQARNTALQEQLLEQARAAGAGEERSRLAREIHDTIAQDLVAIITQLGVVADEPDPDEQRRRLDQVEATARGALGEARRSVQALSSPRLDSDDLPAALKRLLTSWAATTGAATHLEVAGQPRPSAHDDVVLRIAQEALANAARHASPRQVRVGLRYAGLAAGEGHSADGEAEQLTLEVSDDGTGFDAAAGSAAWSSGHGLDNMVQRARAVGGEVRIVSAPGAGTSVTASVPGRWSR